VDGCSGGMGIPALVSLFSTIARENEPLLLHLWEQLQCTGQHNIRRYPTTRSFSEYCRTVPEPTNATGGPIVPCDGPIEQLTDMDKTIYVLMASDKNRDAFDR
jgi:hypothetical protein